MQKDFIMLNKNLRFFAVYLTYDNDVLLGFNCKKYTVNSKRIMHDSKRLSTLLYNKMYCTILL